MRSILSTAVFTAIAGCGLVLAQSEPMIVHGEGMQHAGAMRMEMGGPDDGKVVKGIPLSADIVTSHVQHLADGNKISNEETSHFYRDAEGRTRRENKLMLPGNPTDAPTMVMINDPVAHTRFILNTERKSADKIPAMNEDVNVMYVRKHRDERVAAQGPSGPESETKEDLGTETIEGVVAHGTRATHIIPAGKIGNEKPITVTTESWYSDELGMEVSRTHNDPWSGEVTTKVTNVRRGEQDASLFTPPSNFKVEQGKHVIRLERREGGAPPPPPPPEE